MWSIDRIEIDSGTLCWRSVAKAGRALAFEDVWSAWVSDAAFREFWTASLREIELDAYCWECPSVSDRNRSRRFECVFVSSPSLARMAPEPEAFGEHFHAGCTAVTFANLGGDAVLVAPCPSSESGPWGHLAQFVRSAPVERQHALWKAVGEAMQARVGDEPTWLSTAGHGVAWLHVRLDSTPKYYRHAAYLKA